MNPREAPFDWSNAALDDAATARRMFDVLAERAARAGVALRPPPPEPTTCCARGCNGCVWEGYFSAAAYWREDAKTALRGSG